MSFLPLAAFFVLVAIAIAIAIAIALWVRWLWIHFQAARRALVTWMVTTAVLLALGVCGLLMGLVKAFGAVGGESIDPSQKARVLAEGISEAMNYSLFGLLPVPVMLVVLVAITWRYHGSKAKNSPQSP